MCKVPKAECAAGNLNRGGSAGETQLGEGGREDERDLMRGRIREKETESVCTCVRERGSRAFSEVGKQSKAYHIFSPVIWWFKSLEINNSQFES